MSWTATLFQATACVMAATRVWMVPVGVPIDEATLIDSRGEEEFRALGTRGETIRTQFIIRPGSDWRGVEASIEIEAEDWPAASVLQAATLNTRRDRDSPPDVLQPVNDAEFEKHSVQKLFVRIPVPRDAEAGTYTARVNLDRENGPGTELPIVIRVNDVEMPDTPPLPFVFQYRLPVPPSGVSLADLNPWDDVASQLGIALSPAGNIAREVRLEWARRQGSRDLAFDFTGGDEWYASYPQPSSPAQPDRIRDLCQYWGNALEQDGALKYALSQPIPDADRVDAAQALDTYFRLRRADPRLRLTVVGSLLPRYTGYADVIAVPWSRFAPNEYEIFMTSGALSVEVSAPAKSVTASSSAGDPDGPIASSQPEDAYDGASASVWWSASAPTSTRPESFRIEFEAPCETGEFTIGWITSHLGRDIIVHNTTEFTPRNLASVDWSDPVISGDGRIALVRGEFRSTRPLTSVEFTIRGSTGGRPIGIAEIEFLPPGAPKRLPKIPEIWIAENTTEAFSLDEDRPDYETRLLPHLLWAADFEGFWGRYLLNVGEDALLVDGSDGTIYTTERIEILHEGIEDLMLIRMAEKALRRNREDADEIARWISRPHIAEFQSDSSREAWAATMHDRRKALIRWIEEHGTE